MSEPWTPHPFQLTAVKHLLEHGGAGLFLDPGLGKTSITLAALKVLLGEKFFNQSDGATLVLAPLRVCQLVWPGESKKWTDFEDMKVVVLHGPDKKELAQEKADIYVLNYEGIDWFFDYDSVALRSVGKLVVDESTRLKNSQSKRFKRLKKHLNRFTKRWILTGTPTANGLEDLWAQMFIVDGGAALGKFISHFRMKYFFPPPFGQFKWTLQPGAAQKIYDLVRPFCLRMAAEDYLSLPELVNVPVIVKMPPSVRRIYNEMEDNFITLLEGGPAMAANAAVAGGKCLQICNGALYTYHPEYEELHDEKITALVELIEELNGAPALVFYQYNHDLDRIQKALGGAGAVLAHATTLPALQALEKAFNAGDVPILLGQPASIGHGLNLQGTSNHVIWFGLPWSLELYDQAIKRIWRQGNPNTHVFIHHILAENTIDEKVLRVLGQKDRSQQALFHALLSPK